MDVNSKTNELEDNITTEQSEFIVNHHIIEQKQESTHYQNNKIHKVKSMMSQLH